MKVAARRPGTMLAEEDERCPVKRPRTKLRKTKAEKQGVAPRIE